MTDSYNKIQTELEECEKSITIARKVEHRDNAKMGALRTTHHSLTTRLANAPKTELKESDIQVKPDIKEKTKSSKKSSKD